MAYDAASSIYDVSVWDAVIITGTDASLSGHSARLGRLKSFSGSAATVSTVQAALTIPTPPIRFAGRSDTFSAVQSRLFRDVAISAVGPGCGNGISGGSGAIQILKPGYVPSLGQVIPGYISLNLHMRT